MPCSKCDRPSLLGSKASLCRTCMSTPPDPFPTAEDFAEALGLKCLSGRRPPIDTEEERFIELSDVMLSRLIHMEEPLRIATQSRFSALYLPKLVDVFLDPPPAYDSRYATHYESHNAYALMIQNILSNPYFVKFMLSDHDSAKKGDMMAPRLAERLATKTAEYDRTMLEQGAAAERGGLYPFESKIASTCTILHLLLALQIDKKRSAAISMATRSQLLPVLDKWTLAFKGRPSGLVTERTAGLLHDERAWVDDAQGVRDSYEGLQTCALPGCGALFDLYQCGRCKTVLYCGQDHQAEHWRYAHLPHKAVCYKTSF